jgi:hypothetical protein
MSNIDTQIKEYEKIDVFNIDKRIHYVENILKYYKHSNSHYKQIQIHYWNSILYDLYHIGFEYF